MEPAVVASMIKGILIVGIIITALVLIIIRLTSNYRSKQYAKSIQKRKEEDVIWLAAQPPYTPKGGELKMGTTLCIDWDNPINHGKSAYCNDFWVSDVLYSEARKINLYKLSYRDYDGKDKVMPNPYTKEEVFNWLKIKTETINT